MQEALDELEPLVAALGARARFGLADRELAPVLRRVQSLIAALNAVAAGLAGEAAGRGLPTQSGYRSTQTWLRDALHLSGGGARQLLRLAEVADEFPTVGAAVATGAVTTDQALVIGAALGELRARVPADVVTAAQDRLLGCRFAQPGSTADRRRARARPRRAGDRRRPRRRSATPSRAACSDRPWDRVDARSWQSPVPALRLSDAGDGRDVHRGDRTTRREAARLERRGRR